MEFHHISVMLEETVKGLVTTKEGTYVDCTLGGGGHSSLIASMLTEKGRLIGIDQDAAAISAASERLKEAKCRVDIVHSNFRNLEQILADENAPLVDGVVFDLGVSSHQIDTAERGFSYIQDAPLDMRMNPEADFSAYDVVNNYEEKELNRIFKEYGEERWSKRIAQFIVQERANKPIETTGELVDIICKAVPKAVRQAAGGHPAKRVFQAIRIEVNVITFHSLEDRIAKNVLKELSRGCICPPELPVCMCNHQPEIKIIGKPIQATADELEHNSRSKSAKLRIAEKLPLHEKGGK